MAIRLACALFVSAVLALLPAVSWGQTTVRLCGATSMSRMLQPKLAEIEAKAGVKITLTPNTSGRGLEALVADKAEIAMVAPNLQLAADTLNAQTPGLVDVSKYTEICLFSEPLWPVVNKANLVKAITLEQAKGLFSGQISNWKELGGDDQPVVVVITQPKDGGHMQLKAQLLGGGEFVKTARVMQTQPDISKVISQVPGGFTMMSKANMDDSIKCVDTDKHIIMGRNLITVKDPSPEVKRVIEAIKESLADKMAK